MDFSFLACKQVDGWNGVDRLVSIRYNPSVMNLLPLAGTDFTIAAREPVEAPLIRTVALCVVHIHLIVGTNWATLTSPSSLVRTNSRHRPRILQQSQVAQ